MPTIVRKNAIKRSRQLRRHATEGEKRLWRELKEFRKLYGVHVRRQVPIGPYVADFAIHSARLVIEVDGQFHTEPERMASDATRDRWLHQASYRVLRFRTGELDETLDGCIEEILRELGIVH
ncbi:endonuclease domain-containing protein [Chelativorans xinjiangense]|uniref:endonuclease domain-containing protein n=1 Tax=Chelativorans xinjiangense TaxID=2681485 RepID=UPI0013583BEE|nr:endonuclease domain-containing protein [Chelativorans xinjiangense]